MATTETTTLDTIELEERVQDMYTEVANEPHNEFHFETGRELAERLGYPPEQLNQIPREAIDSFAGVGYYFDLADLQPGETVVDLGSGSGMDSFLAARHVAEGRLIGIDFTDAQLNKSRHLAESADITNADFRKAYIEQPPIDDNSVDCVISNGVFNLSPDKPAVFAAIARILKPGGRLAFSDIVTGIQLPEGITCDAALWAACIGGAMQRDAFLAAIESAGLTVDVVRPNDEYKFLSERADSATTKYQVSSISILATKPANKGASA